MSFSLQNRLQKLSSLFFILILFCGASSSRAEAPANPEQNKRLEQLYLWKLSEELKLSVKQEKILLDLTQSLAARRSHLQEDLQKSLKALAEAKGEASTEKLLKEHRRLLKSQMDLQLEEFDQIKKAFGPEKSAKYFIVKNDLLIKLKNLLLSPTPKSN